MRPPVPTASAVGPRVRTRIERLCYRTYYRLAHANYDRRLVATPKRTPGGAIRTYDLYNRHGRHEMLEALCERCGPSDVVYDVGASVGVYALSLVVESPDRRVRAFEPAPGTVERLSANVAATDPAGRLDVRPVGLGADSGTREFYVSTYPELSGFDRESATRWGATVADVREVPVRTLDEEVADGPAPDVVKIDVEGSGPAVLRGGRETLQTHRPALFVEVHDEGLSGDRPAALREELEAAGYAAEPRGSYWRCEPRD